MSNGELEALAEGILAAAVQDRLDALVASTKKGQLSSEEAAKLDLLLSRVDQLTLVKNRGRYTVRQQQAGVAPIRPPDPCPSVSSVVLPSLSSPHPIRTLATQSTDSPAPP